MENLFKKITEIAKKKRVGKEELLEAIENAEKEYSELKKKLEIQCNKCLREHLKQKKVDEEAYNSGLLRNAIRNLCIENCIENCEYLNVAEDIDAMYCADCGMQTGVGINNGGDYLSYKIRHK